MGSHPYLVIEEVCCAQSSPRGPEVGVELPEEGMERLPVFDLAEVDDAAGLPGRGPEEARGRGQVDSRLFLVAGQHPGGDAGRAQLLDGLDDSVLQAVFDADGSQQRQVSLHPFVHVTHERRPEKSIT